MLTTAKFQDLPEFLAQCIAEIRKTYPRFSARQISKKIGVPNSTFDRISKQEVKKPSFNYALKIVQEVCDEDNLQSFIKKFYPSMYKEFLSVYPGNSDVEFIKPEGEIYFQDTSTYELMMMATSYAGLTRSKTLEEFGKRGLATLDKLVEEGILKENDGKISLDSTVNAKQDTVQKLLQNLVKTSYDLDAFGDHKNWLSVQYESVNLDFVMPRLRDIYVNANQEVRELFMKPQAKGNDVVWAGMAMDSLSKHSTLYDQTKEEKK